MQQPLLEDCPLRMEYAQTTHRELRKDYGPEENYLL